MHRMLKALVVAAATMLAVASAASAATVTFTNADPTPQISLTIDDAASPGKFRFSLSTISGTADYLGLGFNFSGSSLAPGDITLVSATRANGAAITPTLQLFGNNTVSESNCGAGCNFNGSGSASVFDYIIRIGSNGGGQTNYVASVVFDIAATGSLNTLFTQLAVRAQSTSNPGGSIKTDLTPSDPAPVPLPAGLPLLGSGLVAIGILRRRRVANAAA